MPAPQTLASESYRCLNESPSQKEGKFYFLHHARCHTHRASMKVPSKEERKSDAQLCGVGIWTASMKALPKRKGNGLQTTAVVFPVRGLNESPSQ